MASQIRRFFGELKRRKVFRVAAGYTVVALAVWQAADIAFPALDLPPTAITFVLALTIIGFPVALVLAWAYEVRPDEATGAAAVPVVAAAGGPPSPAEPAAVAAPPASLRDSAGRSIAVLPFENMSDEADSQYFADGIAEELTSALARVRDLRVAARTSAFAFRDSKSDARDIARALGVGYLVEGSVRRAGRRLRVTAQLIDAGDGYHVWSERYERRLGDVFEIQDDIVETVTENLLERMPFGGELRTPALTENPEAYDTYLRARRAYLQLNPSAMVEAEELYRTAIAQDPDFALAHSGLAEALTFLAIGFGTEPPREIMPSAREAAERALSLAPELAEAHLVRGLVELYHDWDYPAARAEMERALELSPSFFEAHMWMEMYYTYVEADDEAAMRMAERARLLSPFDPGPRSRLATIHYIFGRYDEAEAILGRMFEEGNVVMAGLGLADVLMRTGRTEEAIPYVRSMLAVRPAANAALGVGGTALALSGRREEARDCLRELKDRGAGGPAAHFWIACVLSALGRLDEAFDRLDRAVEERDPNLLYLSVVPRNLGLAEDLRFSRILERIGLEHLAPGAGSGAADCRSAVQADPYSS